MAQMTDIAIRPLEPDDFDHWQQLFTGYLGYYETSLSQDIKQSTFARLLDPGSKLHCRLAISNGAPVGLVHYIFHDNTWRPEGVCYLQDLYSDPAVRGAGVGRKLIETVYQAAADAGVPTVYWMTQDFNTTARRLYDKVATKTPFIRYQHG
ncbi:MAG: GNAT family N-acetyltransferase [Paracoccaceae bacterium]